MNQDGTRDLQWWRIPAWAPPAKRLIVGGLVGGLGCGLPFQEHFLLQPRLAATGTGLKSQGWSRMRSGVILGLPSDTSRGGTV